MNLGLNKKQRIVKSVHRQLADGRQVFKEYGPKVVGNKVYRSVLSTVVKPNGQATHTLHIKGLLKRSWKSEMEYKKLTRRKAIASAVMASPVTQGGLALTTFGAAILTFPGVTPTVMAKGLVLPSVITGVLVSSKSDSQMAPNVQNLNQ